MFMQLVCFMLYANIWMPQIYFENVYFYSTYAILEYKTNSLLYKKAA